MVELGSWNTGRGLGEAEGRQGEAALAAWLNSNNSSMSQTPLKERPRGQPETGFSRAWSPRVLREVSLHHHPSPAPTASQPPNCSLFIQGSPLSTLSTASRQKPWPVGLEEGARAGAMENGG